MRTEADFLNWLSQASIHVGYNRYGKVLAKGEYGHGFVCASVYDWVEDFATAIDDLDGGDNDMFEAAEVIERYSRDMLFLAVHPNPAEAMRLMVEKMRQYYFDVLNKEGQ